MIVSYGAKREESWKTEEVAMSPATKEMLSALRAESSASLDGEVVFTFEERRRTVIFVEGGARAEREVRMDVPSSPAPRTRMLELVDTIVERYEEKELGK